MIIIIITTILILYSQNKDGFLRVFLRYCHLIT